MGIALSISLPAITLVAAQDRCNNFNVNLDNVIVTRKTYYPANAAIAIVGPAGNFSSNTVPAFCRVEFNITTNPATGSRATNEIWLPDIYNGRFLATGNVVQAGTIQYGTLAYDGIQQGFATVGTDTGHFPTMPDLLWAQGNPDALIDFGHRALHLATVAGKSMITDYYGEAAKYNYYLGCSTGGRQGLKAITMYPEDYDGIAFGTPANQMAGLLPWSIRQGTLVQPEGGPNWLSQADWAKVGKEVLKQCDGLDGVVDGVLNDPYACKFNPQKIKCNPNSDPSTCITKTQIDTIEKLYADYYLGQGSKATYLFSGYTYGGEMAYPTGLSGAQPFGLGLGYYKFAVLNDSNWDYKTLNDATIGKGFEINPGMLDVKEPDFMQFYGRGGKMLHYAGLADQLISSGASYKLYNDAAALTKKKSPSLKIDDYYKFYPIPGMNHCFGGNGANAFGGSGQRTRSMSPLTADAKHDVLRAVLDWVETGNQPGDLIATKYNNDTIASGLRFTRKLCAYPKKAVYNGGDQNSEASYTCQAGK